MTNKEKVKKGPALSKVRQHLVEGFSLIEVLLAVFILEIGLLGISTFYAYSHKIAKMARNQTIATNLAQGVLDEEIAKSYDALTVGTTGPAPYSPDAAFSTFNKQIDISCINASLSPLTCDANTHMKKVVVTISWTEDNSNKSVQIATIIADF